MKATHPTATPYVARQTEAGTNCVLAIFSSLPMISCTEGAERAKLDPLDGGCGSERTA